MVLKNISVLSIDQFKASEQHAAFYANSISNHLVTSHLHINKPHKHDFYATMLFTNGSGIHDIDFNRYEVKPGSVFVLAPGQTHHWELSADVEGIIFLHTQEFYDMHYLHENIKEYPFFSSLQGTNAIVLPQEKLAQMTFLFEQIISEEQAEYFKKKAFLLAMVSQVYISLSRILIEESVSEHVVPFHYNTQFSKFEALVEKHFLTEKSPEQYAKWMNMTPKNLNRINKMVVNKTTSDIIMERVFLESKRMLVYSHENFNQIAFALGYEDYAYFSKLFKKKIGETPSAFLKKYQ